MAGNNIHSGHRSRVKERFLRNGLSEFEKHNMLELLLFYAIPQKDTNVLAHMLLNKFGTLKGVFEASPEELCTVDGISMHTATLIKLVPAIWSEAFCEIDKTKVYNSVSKLGRLMLDKYAGATVEIVYLVLLDNSWHIIDIIKVCEGSVNQVYADIGKIVEIAIKRNAAKVLLTHNHPNGSLIASAEDLNVTAEIDRIFKTLNVTFLEHLLIAGNGYEPLVSKNEGVLWQKEDRRSFYT